MDSFQALGYVEIVLYIFAATNVCILFYVLEVHDTLILGILKAGWESWLGFSCSYDHCLLIEGG